MLLTSISTECTIGATSAWSRMRGVIYLSVHAPRERERDRQTDRQTEDREREIERQKEKIERDSKRKSKE